MKDRALALDPTSSNPTEQALVSNAVSALGAPFERSTVRLSISHSALRLNISAHVTERRRRRFAETRRGA